MTRTGTRDSAKVGLSGAVTNLEPSANKHRRYHPDQLAAMNPTTPEGTMPAKVSDSERATVTAGLANDVEAVNQLSVGPAT
jgi:hypothetical protein